MTASLHTPRAKPGYKQTEVGVIPEEWEVSTVGREFDVKLGKMLDAEKNVGVPKPYLGNRAVQWDRIDISELPMVRMTRADMDRFRLRKGDLLACEGGEVGRAAIWDAPIEECYFQKALHRLRPLRRFDVRLMVGLLRQWSERGVLSNYVTQTSIAHLPREKFMELPMPVPPPPEQRAIAEALSDVDGLLGGLDRLIAKKRDLKQAAMQQLLTGQTRLPGFHGEWGVKTLFELAARKKELFDDGDWIESEHITTEGIRLIQTGNIGVGNFVEKDEKKYINESSFASLRCKQLRQGDLLVCRLADPAGRACVLGDISGERIVTSVDVTIFRPPSKLADRLFLAQVFSTSDWFRAVSDRSGGTTHKRISRGALGRLSINLPSVPEQTAIAEVLTEMDLELAALEQRREKTRALKQAMMQELLTGKTRLLSA